MSEAPRDSTDLLVVYDDFSGAEVIFWGELGEPPYTEGWVTYTRLPGELEHTEWLGEDTHCWVGWVPYPKQFGKFEQEKEDWCNHPAGDQMPCQTSSSST